MLNWPMAIFKGSMIVQITTVELYRLENGLIYDSNSVIYDRGFFIRLGHCNLKSIAVNRLANFF